MRVKRRAVMMSKMNNKNLIKMIQNGMITVKGIGDYAQLNPLNLLRMPPPLHHK
jgi:hypothetical protein